jgi:Trp operon repressor
VVDYYVFVPDFMERYTAMVMNQTRAGGASQAEITNQAEKMESYKEMYKNPLLVVLLTYSEVLPVGLVVTIISALILKRRTRKEVHA